LEESSKNLSSQENPFHSKHVVVIFSRSFRQDSSYIGRAFVIVFFRKAKENRSRNEISSLFCILSFFTFLQEEHSTPVGIPRPPEITETHHVRSRSEFCVFVANNVSLAQRVCYHCTTNATTKTRLPLLFVVLKSLHELWRIEINQSCWRSSFAVVVLLPADYIMARMFLENKKASNP